MKSLGDWLASSSSSSSSNSGGGGSDTAGSGGKQSSNARDGLATSGAEGKGPLHLSTRSNPSQTPTNASMDGFPGSVSVAGSVVSSASPTVGRTPTTNFSPTGRGRNLDETRAKMEKLLGQESIQRAMSPTSGSPFGGSVTSQSAAHVPYGMTPVTSNATTTPFTAAAAAQASGAGGDAHMQTQVPSSPVPPSLQDEQQQQHQRREMMAKYEPVEVMVVDRGTQTVSTVGVQTDPEPPFPPTIPGVTYPPGYTAPTYVPLYSAGFDYTSRSSGARFGVDGRPYRQQFHELEQRQTRDANELRKQLELIQNSIDMLISRYNLPPPPPA